MIKLLFFHASWCGQCRMMEPLIKSLKGVELIDVDVEEIEDAARLYNIVTLPTVLLIKDGVELSRLPGPRTKAFYEAEIKRIEEGRK